LIVSKFENLSTLAAESARLDILHKSCKKISEEEGLDSALRPDFALLPDVETPKNDVERIELIENESNLKVEQMSLLTPNRAFTICRDLDVSLSPGDTLLVIGDSGCGKSSLLRAFAGLWREGSGIVKAPSFPSVLFVPQKPYMTLGNLRSQIRYPDAEFPNQVPSTFGKLNISEPTCDVDLVEALRKVKLDHVAERWGLDAVIDWTTVLSLGEQQRLQIARILSRRPTPSLIFLDEATSSMDPANESRVYNELTRLRCSLSELSPALVSVGHRPSLIPFHRRVLQWYGSDEDGAGLWQVLDMSEYQQAGSFQVS